MIMNQNQFLALELNQISQVYFGKDNHCRCGCGGDYIATSFMVEPRSGVNDKLAMKRLVRAKRLVEKGAEVDYCSNHVNISTGNNRALTFYFDEVAK